MVNQTYTAILKALAMCPMTLADLEEETGLSGIRSALVQLTDAGTVISKARDNASNLYCLTPQGLRAAHRTGGGVAGPRIPYSTDTYVPSPGAYIDPARLKFLDAHSLVNGERIPRVRPALISSRDKIAQPQ